MLPDSSIVIAVFLGMATNWICWISPIAVEAAPVVLPEWTMPFASPLPWVTTMSSRPALIEISAVSAATRATCPLASIVPDWTMRGATSLM